MIVLDTNVLSELTKGQKTDPRVREWFSRNYDTADTAITIVNVAELRAGVTVMPPSRKRQEIAEFYEDTIDQLASRGRLLGLSMPATWEYARLVAKRRAMGRRVSSAADALIAAICLTEGAALATRNIKDFEGIGLELVNPWGDGGTGSDG